MRIRTNADESVIRKAISDMPGVSFETLTVHGSRTHKHGFEVKLSGNSSRAPMHAPYGADKAATWDEWGIFLARVYDADATTKAAYYLDAEDFHYKTGRRFRTLTHDNQCHNHKWNSLGNYEAECKKCGATQRWK